MLFPRTTGDPFAKFVFAARRNCPSPIVIDCVGMAQLQELSRSTIVVFR